MSDINSEQKVWLHGLLFGLTVLTTWFAGMYLFGRSFVWVEDAPLPSLFDPRVIGLGFLYALALMIILTGHELGHYLTCRRYEVRATLPYFIPGLPFLGTFGAFIRIKSYVRFKHQWFDIGANGPLTGFALTLPVLAIGMALSKVVPLPATSGGGIIFGESLLFKLLSGLFFGRIAAGSTLVLHPVGYAGWAGLLVTALNLIPFSQLDGGHISYALLGRRARLLSRVMLGFLAVMGVFFHASWLVLAAVVLFFDLKSKMRLGHPAVIDEEAPLGLRRTVLSIVVALVFVLSFIPDPVKGYSLLDLLKGAPGG